MFNNLIPECDIGLWKTFNYRESPDNGSELAIRENSNVLIFYTASHKAIEYLHIQGWIQRLLIFT